MAISSHFGAFSGLTCFKNNKFCVKLILASIDVLDIGNLFIADCNSEDNLPAFENSFSSINTPSLFNTALILISGDVDIAKVCS